MSDVDVIHACTEDFIAPYDPEEWDTIYTVTTRKGCPRCGIALGVVFGNSIEGVDNVAQNMCEDHNMELPTGWHGEYKHPVYIFCDSVECGYHSVTGWEDMRCTLPAWLVGDAETWQEHISKD